MIREQSSQNQGNGVRNPHARSNNAMIEAAIRSQIRNSTAKLGVIGLAPTLQYPSTAILGLVN